tara:strand:- start:127 stop:783 length:657 start_codon:yes stop_codon:yes gene_type:complete
MSANIKLSLTNVLQFISIMTPFLLIFFFTLSSIFTGNILKGLIYLFGIVIVSGISRFLQNIIKSEQSQDASPFCNILPFPFVNTTEVGSIYSSPYLNSSILGFTLTYVLYPMVLNKYTTNPSAIVALIVLTIINSLVEYMNKCSNIGGIVMGILIGGIIGLIWYFLIINSGYKNLAYFSEIVSNNIMCSKPSEQFYQCTYYRNGIKISDEDMNRIFTT